MERAERIEVIAPARPTLREWLQEAPFALAMSSGFFGFYAHLGALTALEDAGLLPARVAGSSAGALITAGWAAGIDTEDFARTLFDLRREDFWDPALGAGLLRGALFRAKLDALLPVATFAECRVPAAVSVFDVLARRTRVIDRGGIAVAIQASCALPLLFQPVWIEGRPYIDGGVADRPGLAGIPDDERVLFHHLTSKSPWRSAPSLKIPQRDRMTVIAIPDLPRVGPFKLHVGRDAYERARAGFRAALERAV